MKQQNLNETQIMHHTLQWESDGYKFLGNGSENNDYDPYLCPFCGEDNIFWALWQHPEDEELIKSANLCLHCGSRWIDLP